MRIFSHTRQLLLSWAISWTATKSREQLSTWRRQRARMRSYHNQELQTEMRAEFPRFMAIMCEYWTKVVHCSEYVVVPEKATTKTAQLQSNQLFELNGCWKSELVGRKKGIGTRMPSELSKRTFTQGRNSLLVNTDGFFYGERSGGHLLRWYSHGWRSHSSDWMNILSDRGRQNNDQRLRIHHDVNDEVMTNHNNSRDGRVLLFDTCDSQQPEKIRVKWSGLARYWRSARTHSTLKGATLIGRSIIVGFVDNTSSVLITKGKAQMLTLCKSGEATSKDAPRQNWVFETKVEASFLEEGPNPKVDFDARWLVGRWLDMDGSGEEFTKQKSRPAGLLWANLTHVLKRVIVFFSKPKRCLVLLDVVAYRGFLSWTCTKFWAGIQWEERTQSDRKLFSGHPDRSQHIRQEKKDTMLALNFWGKASHSADSRKSVDDKQTLMWVQRSWRDDGKMNPQCALQMRSTFGTDILMQERGSFWGREPRSSTLPKKMMKEDQKSHMGMQTLRGRWGWSYWKTTIHEENISKWSFGNRRPCEYEVWESWFLVERCTANRYACIECGRCQTFITKDTGQCEWRFVNQEEVSEVRRSGKGQYLEGNSVESRILTEELLTLRGSWKTIPYQISEGVSGNSRPKAPQPHGGTPEHRTKKECTLEQKKDVVTRCNAVTAARGDQSTL